MTHRIWHGPTADQIAVTLVNQAWWTGETRPLRSWARGGGVYGYQRFRHDCLSVLAEAWPRANVVRLAELCGVIPELD